MPEDKSAIKIYLVIIGLTVLLSIPRFMHYVAPDSTHYVELASYFAGDTEKEELRTPFTYRVLVPYLASLGPSAQLDLNFAIINTVFTAGAFIIFYFYLQRLIADRAQFNFGLLLLIIAFPTVNYTSGVMTDAAGFFFFVLAVYLFLIKRFLFFTISLTVGVFAREAILVLLFAVAVYILLSYIRGPKDDREPWLILSFFPPILAYAGIRWFFSDLPNFFWSPTWEQFMFTVSRPVAWTTFLLTLMPPVIFLFLGYRRKLDSSAEVFARWSFHTRRLLVSLTAAGIVLNIYSVTSAALSGRFVWPFYVVLVPMAAAYFHDDGSLLFSISGTIADKIFGHSQIEQT